MGILKKLFKEKEKSNNLVNIPGLDFSVTPTSSTRLDRIRTTSAEFNIHPDLQGLIWVGDGPMKNYNENMFEDYSSSVGTIRVSFSYSGDEEPSLIFTMLPISVKGPEPEKLPYYPSYRNMSPRQRGMYLKFLENPYDSRFEIGYVFVLYYGLERHLVSGEHERALSVILKLRDVHANSSFQYYSSTAVVLASMMYQRADYLMAFLKSIDKEYEYCVDDSVMLLCKYILNLPLDAKDLMRMAKTFEFNKTTYIKKYPEIFIETLSENIKESFGSKEIHCRQYIKESEFRKLPQKHVSMFANISLSENKFDVPLIEHSFAFKKSMNDLLNQTHEDVKKKLAKMRKDGSLPREKDTVGDKNDVKTVLTFDSQKEAELLKVYNDAKDGSLDQHFASIALQDFYYKYRSLDDKYIQLCMKYCQEDILNLGSIQQAYLEEERRRILSLSDVYDENEIMRMLNSIESFKGVIPAFKRLAIVYEKQKRYDKALKVCEGAISYYSKIGHMMETISFEERREKLIKKMEIQ